MNDEGAHRLAQAIIVQAAQDYRRALRGFSVAGTLADTVRRRCEHFFSDWFVWLTGGRIDGRYIVDGIKAEVGEVKRRKALDREQKRQS